MNIYLHSKAEVLLEKNCSIGNKKGAYICIPYSPVLLLLILPCLEADTVHEPMNPQIIKNRQGVTSEMSRSKPKAGICYGEACSTSHLIQIGKTLQPRLKERPLR